MQPVNENNWQAVCEMPRAIVEFSAPWCGPCKMQGQILRDLEGDAVGVFVGEVNIDEDCLLADRLGIKSVPTLVVLANGHEQKRMNGLQQRETVRSVLKGI